MSVAIVPCLPLSTRIHVLQVHPFIKHQTRTTALGYIGTWPSTNTKVWVNGVHYFTSCSQTLVVLTIWFWFRLALAVSTACQRQPKLTHGQRVSHATRAALEQSPRIIARLLVLVLGLARHFTFQATRFKCIAP